MYMIILAATFVDSSVIFVLIYFLVLVLVFSQIISNLLTKTC